MKRWVSYGECALCGKRSSKAAISRHLKDCASSQPRNGKAVRLLHLRIEGQHQPGYWLDLEIPAAARLQDLDGFLRFLWLECCGHLSSFHIREVEYTAPMNGGMDDIGLGLWGRKPVRKMNARLYDAVPQDGAWFSYQYDFGSTTELKIRLAGERKGSIGAAGQVLLARNEAPKWPCSKCGQPATQVCTECDYEEDPFFCDQHAEHPCGEESLRPVVNSPRMGVCGYTG